jgi:ABC-type nitrate/sulfonate/bicarbonate transport system ATPase subunit
MHVFVLGLSKTGKSTLARAIADDWNGHVIAFDPLGDPKWKASADFVTRDFDDFAKIYQTNRSCLCVVDECHLIKDMKHKTILMNMNAVGRHYGHTNLFIGHRVTSVPKGARMLSERFLVFRQAPDDAKEIYGDYPHDAIKSLPQLQRGEYLDFDTFNCEKRKIF